jgi:hypothetical protein
MHRPFYFIALRLLPALGDAFASPLISFGAPALACALGDAFASRLSL